MKCDGADRIAPRAPSSRPQLGCGGRRERARAGGRVSHAGRRPTPARPDLHLSRRPPPPPPPPWPRLPPTAASRTPRRTF